MRLGVTMRTVDASEYIEPRDALSYDWTRYLYELGHVPILIPSAYAEPVRLFDKLECDALLLTNGEDVTLENGSQNWSGSARDITEARLLKHCIESKIPVLGVCRGLQFINSFLGGTQRAAVSNHVAIDHPLQIIDSTMSTIVDSKRILTNSYHQMVVTLEDLANDLRPFAVIEDVVEGFFSKELNILAIQWHPERKNPSAQIDKILIANALSGIGAHF